jgi:(p)ppGpp synthase/HD superfamily hydrolase
VTIPKINGYQSIHTGISIEHEDEKILVEIQICTQLMYQKSEQ